MSVSATLAPGAFLFSSAHCSFAPSSWRRLLMQAFFCAVVRARTKFGIAIAARRPMMATTIMISTSVKPLLRAGVYFMVGRGGLYALMMEPIVAAQQQP